MADGQMNGTERGRRMLRESGYASGGAVHSDEAEDKTLIRSMLGKARIKAKSGGKIKGEAVADRPDRRARGGHVGKPGIGKVNIVIAHGGDKPPMPGGPMQPPVVLPPHPPMMPPAGAGGPPMPPPAMAMGAGPRPGMPMPPPGPVGPPGAMPPMMPHAMGGRVRDRMGRFVGGAI